MWDTARQGAEVQEIGNVIHGAQTRSQVAMILSYDSRFAFQIQPNNPRFHYPEHFHDIYRAFYQQHISMDIASPHADLYVESGGTLVVSQRSGVKDENNAVVNQRLPGLLAELCGIEVEEYDSLTSQMQNEIEIVVPGLADSPCVRVGLLCDILKPTSATVVARCRLDYYAGKPAITLNEFGAGRVLYIGAVGDRELYEVLSKWLLKTVEMQDGFHLPAGVELSRRIQGDKKLHFVLNHTDRPQTLHLENHFTNVINHQPVRGEVQLAPFDVLILHEAALA